MIDSEKLMNSQALIGVFGSVPSFVNSELLDVQLKRDGPTLFIRLMTKEVVRRKPARWTDGWDVVYVEMSFFAILKSQISGWSNNNVIEYFEIKSGEKGVLVIRCENKVEIKCEFDWARIEQIKPGLIGSP